MLAMTTPGSKELDHDRALIDDLVETVCVERDNISRVAFHITLDDLRSFLLILHELEICFNSAGNTDINRIRAVLDVHDGGISVDLKALGKVIFNSAIDLSNIELALSFDCKLLPNGSKFFAVGAPGSKELDHPDTFLGENKVVLVEIEDLAGFRRPGDKINILTLPFLGDLFEAHNILHIVEIGFNSERDTDILRGSTVLDVFDGGEAVDTKALDEVLLDSAINLSNMELALSLG